MQQTTQYQLNLIETDDAFSPNPLNDNAQKLEAALQAAEAAQAAEAQAREESDGALEQRIAHIEGFKMVSGAYTGTNQERTINLGFHPQLVLISNETDKAIVGRSAPELYSTTYIPVASIASSGFTVYGPPYQRFNVLDRRYHYFAMG